MTLSASSINTVKYSDESPALNWPSIDAVCSDFAEGRFSLLRSRGQIGEIGGQIARELLLQSGRFQGRGRGFVAADVARELD